MEILTSFIGILGVLSLGIMSPGPSFVLVARTSVAVSRFDGLATAIGMGLGGMVFAILALLGIKAVLLSVPYLYLVLKILGGAYLIFLAVVIWRSADVEVDFQGQLVDDNSTLFKSFKVGLITQLSNPKTAIFYGSIFAALLPPDIPIEVVLMLAPIIFLLEAGWYSLVALVLSLEAPKNVYLNSKYLLDRLAGGVIGVLGMKLIIDAGSSH